MELQNQKLIEGIRKGDMVAFEELYNQYYVFLCVIAEHIVKNSSDAEEIVSDVFIKLWNIRERIKITTSVKGYLVKAVRNTSLNYIERDRFINNNSERLSSSDNNLLAWDSDYPLGQLYEKEVNEVLESAISTLPDACRNVFLLSRKDNLKYSDIASKLEISVNTVKTQMKIALAHLRKDMKDYLTILIILIVK
jgi:RNA polymerase sigma-70 factor (ECF subfamily)